MAYKHIIIGSKCLFQQDHKIDEQALEMVCHLLVARYKPIILINDSFANIEHTKILLKKISFFNEKDLYGTTEQIEAQTFLQICKSQNIEPTECIFIDGPIENLDVAAKLKILTIKFESVKDCLQALVDQNIIVPQTLYYDSTYLESLELEKAGSVNCMYPSLVGLYDNSYNSTIIKWDSENQIAIPTDDCDANGNPRKICLYESYLAKSICDDARDFWQDAYVKINDLFLIDFSIKSDKTSTSLNKDEAYKKYFSHIETILKKFKIINQDTNHTLNALYEGLKKLFSIDFDLAAVSQFYYDIWLHDYGPKHLEPFVFLANEIKSAQSEQNEKISISSLYTNEKNNAHNDLKINLLKNVKDITNDYESRMQAYCEAQPWIYCGKPQLRGRIKKENPQLSYTIGILRDDDPYAENLHTDKHFAAKNAFSPFFEHTIAKDLKKLGCPIIGGPSGTLGRNIYMLAPLIENGLLTYNDVQKYIMIFCADIVKRGHHSYGECGVTASQIVASNFLPWLDPIRGPVKFYEQFLTDEFKNSTLYKEFVVKHQDFFNEPLKNVTQNKNSF